MNISPYRSDARTTLGPPCTDRSIFRTLRAHCPEFPRCSHSGAEWHLGKRISTLAPGFPANRGTAPGRGRSVITPQLCMLSKLTAVVRWPASAQKTGTWTPESASIELHAGRIAGWKPAETVFLVSHAYDGILCLSRCRA